MRWLDWWSALTIVTVGLALLYAIVLFVLGFRRPHTTAGADDLFFVVLVPCLNEEVVIARTIQRLLALRGSNLAVMVIDDGSDDATCEIVESFPRDRVWLLRRTLPDARLGKGEALNAGFRELCDSDLLRGRPSDRVVVGVVDADGRLDADTLEQIRPYFTDSKVGGVQICVRMYNRDSSLLARMQDVEFATFGQVFQRGRDVLRSVGLGGNGQFARLLALRSVGTSPWSRCLTEDLELTVQLHARGWDVRFCPDVAVSQQAVITFRRLIRQRTRWFQGYLQCIGLLTFVNGSPKARVRKKLEFSFCLVMPVLLLANSLMILFGYLIVGSAFLAGDLEVSGTSSVLLAALALYALSFATVPLVAHAYRRTADASWLRAVGLAHLYVVYTLLWIPSAWRALVHQLRGQDRWDKTTRTASAADVIDLRDVIDVREAEGSRIA